VHHHYRPEEWQPHCTLAVGCSAHGIVGVAPLQVGADLLGATTIRRARVRSVGVLAGPS